MRTDLLRRVRRRRRRPRLPLRLPLPGVATGLVSSLLVHPGIFGVVAEVDGEVAGSNFIDARSSIAGVGPITVDPSLQDSAVGRMLMAAVMEHVEGRVAGVRLVQTAYHARSLALYAKLGFRVREPLACMQGPPSVTDRPARRSGRPRPPTGRPATGSAGKSTVTTAPPRSRRRAGSLGQALARRTRGADDRILDGPVLLRPTASGRTVDDVEALIGAAAAFGGPGILVPMRNAALFRSCLEHGLRVVQVMTLMTTGLYNEPAGAYLPSVMFRAAVAGAVAGILKPLPAWGMNFQS